MSSPDGDDAVAVLLDQCKSNDVDTKVDALAKLQLELDRGVQLSSLDPVIATLKTCLRTSNTHLYTAALSAISSFLTSLDDPASMGLEHPLLRQLVTAFIPAGGAIDRLGDAREKPRERARDVLVRLGSMCFKACGSTLQTAPKGKDASKTLETPLGVFERNLREVGLGNKLWRVREQSILVLVHIRRLYPMFPIRPFLSNLVQALQDTDAAVRDCARKSIIEVFTGMGVTDAARADLKREMEKIGIRKATMSEILGEVIGKFSGGTPATENPIAQPAARALPSRTISALKDSTDQPPDPGSPVPQEASDAEIVPVFIASSKDLEHEFQKMTTYFQGKETEHNWLDREKSIIRLRSMLRGGVQDRYPEVFLGGLKQGMLEATFKALQSLRTTVASQACAFYVDIASFLKTAADPFVEPMLSQLLRMAGFTKKIIATQTQQAVDIILQNTSCQPRATVPLLWQTMQEKTVAARGFAVGHVKLFIGMHGNSSRQAIEATGHLETLEKCINKGLADPSPIVRDPARHCFWSFHSVWPERGKAILGKLDPVGRKQLEKVCPVPGALVSVPQPPTTEARKPSVAAAIAANRAKAKQIAAAPPTLRHQATATAQSAPRAAPVGVPVRDRRTPSTTTLPPSPDASPRGTPSPPLSGFSGGKFRPNTHSPPPPQIRRVPKSPSPPEQRPRVASRGALVATPAKPPQRRVAPPEKTPSAKSDATQSTVPSSPLTTSQRSDPAPDQSFNLMSFNSPATSAPSTSSLSRNAISTSEPDPAIEEELRASAAQAEAAAEQLLDLSQTAMAGSQSSSLSAFQPPSHSQSPITPARNGDVWKQVDKFKNSPLSNRPPPQLSLLEDRPQSSWWFKIKSKIEGTEPPPLGDAEAQVRELKRCISALDQCIAEMRELRSLIWICRNNPTTTQEDGEPALQQSQSPVWSETGLFDSLLNTLLRFLLLEKEETRLQGGLILLYEIVDNQAGQINGLEMRIYETLMVARNSEDKAIFEATRVIRDVLGAKIDPLYGLATLHTRLREFLKSSKVAGDEISIARSHIFGLIGTAKFILRLPPEVLEDEIMRMRPLLLESLTNSNSAVREAASMTVVAAQIVLQDQAHLFTLLDGLSEEKKNFLTYMFNKNDVHNMVPETSANPSPQMQRVRKEMQKLDERLNPR